MPGNNLSPAKRRESRASRQPALSRLNTTVSDHNGPDEAELSFHSGYIDSANSIYYSPSKGKAKAYYDDALSATPVDSPVTAATSPFDDFPGASSHGGRNSQYHSKDASSSQHASTESTDSSNNWSWTQSAANTPLTDTFDLSSGPQSSTSTGTLIDHSTKPHTQPTPRRELHDRRYSTKTSQNQPLFPPSYPVTASSSRHGSQTPISNQENLGSPATHGPGWSFWPSSSPAKSGASSYLPNPAGRSSKRTRSNDTTKSSALTKLLLKSSNAARDFPIQPPRSVKAWWLHASRKTKSCVYLFCGLLILWIVRHRWRRDNVIISGRPVVPAQIWHGGE